MADELIVLKYRNVVGRKRDARPDSIRAMGINPGDAFDCAIENVEPGRRAERARDPDVLATAPPMPTALISPVTQRPPRQPTRRPAPGDSMSWAR